MFNEVFNRKALFLKPRPPTSSTNPLRFTDEHTRLLGKVSELYEGAPKCLHADIEQSESFYEVVSDSSLSVAYQLQSEFQVTDLMLM